MPQQHAPSEENELAALLLAADLTAYEKLRELSDEEAKELANWLREDPNHAQWKEALSNKEHLLQLLLQYRSLQQTQAGDWETFRQMHLSNASAAPVHRVHFLRKWGWAAAIILAIGTIAYLYYQPTGKGDTNTTKPGLVTNDIAPGTDKAMLTLADGSVISLDSAAAGQLAMQGNTRIMKDADGKISYTPDGLSDKAIMLNTMSTPKGGQYQLVLPDGTKAWLNAASSITYPAVFAAKERNISVTGEVYLEVHKDKSRPFHVTTGPDKITVLGTSFNVSNYTDEPSSKTSLLEGRVNINGLILEPGQAYEKGRIAKTNIQQDLAWKNGVFNFTNRDVPAVFRQLARWYNIEVRFEGTPPVRKLAGEMSRKLPLSDMLELLSEFDLQFKIDGRLLTVKGH